MTSRFVVLFDIDGTLVWCGGAGGQALCAALSEEFSIATVRPVAIHGRTDLGIINELLCTNGLAATSENRQRLLDRYFGLLPQYVQQKQSAQEARILPGVLELLQSIQQDACILPGLMTGNMPSSARIKLEHFSLWSFFKLGIYGDLVDHRPLLATPALQAVSEHCGFPVSGDGIIVIGDTPLDIELARAMGARSLGVCTGGFQESELSLAGADHVLTDLSPTQHVLDWIRRS